MGAALQALEDHAGAVEALRKATELKPEFAAAQYCLGVSLLKLGQRTEAADILAATIGQPVQSQSDNVWRTKAQALLDHVKREEEQQSGRGVPAG